MTRAHVVQRSVEAAALFPPPRAFRERDRDRARREYRVLVYRARGLKLREVAEVASVWFHGSPVTIERVRQVERSGLLRVRRWIGGRLPCEIPEAPWGSGP